MTTAPACEVNSARAQRAGRIRCMTASGCGPESLRPSGGFVESQHLVEPGAVGLGFLGLAVALVELRAGAQEPGVVGRVLGRAPERGLGLGGLAQAVADLGERGADLTIVGAVGDDALVAGTGLGPAVLLSAHARQVERRAGVARVRRQRRGELVP